MKNTKTIKTILFASLIAAMILPFSGMNFADAKQADDKSLVKEKIKDKMNKQADKDKNEKYSNTKYTSDEYGIPYNLIFEENGKLVVGIDAEKTKEFGKQYSKEQIQQDLQTDMDMDVKYYVITRDADPTLTNVYGGSIIKKSLGGINYEDGTISLVRNGKIITTGHLQSQGGQVLMPCGGTNLCSGTVSLNPALDGAYADAALVTTTSSYLNLVQNTIKYGSTLYSVTADGTASDLGVNSLVRMAGINTSGSSGNILDNNVTIRDSNGVLNDQVVANYPSIKGDSGAPVFKLTSTTTAKIVGVHVGKACEVDLNSGTTFGWWCGGSTPEGLTFFSPWSAVKSRLGI